MSESSGGTFLATIEVEVEAATISRAATKAESEAERINERPQEDVNTRVTEVAEMEGEDDDD